MAETKVQFCFEVPMPQQAINYAVAVDEAVTALENGETLGEGFCARVEDRARLIYSEYEHGSGSRFDDAGGGRLLVRHQGDNAELDVVADIIEATLAAFNIPGTVTIEFSFTCPVLRPGKIGRGYALVSASGQDWCDPDDWMAGVWKAADRRVAGADMLGRRWDGTGGLVHPSIAAQRTGTALQAAGRA
jgi:hypothetical protein